MTPLQVMAGTGRDRAHGSESHIERRPIREAAARATVARENPFDALTAESGMIAFPPPQRWARPSPSRPGDCGIAYSWGGWAWVWLSLYRAGVTAPDERMLAGILTRLERVTGELPWNNATSYMVGCGAATLLAALAHPLDPERISPVLDQQLEHWTSHCLSTEQTDYFCGAAGALLAMIEIEHARPGTIPARLIRHVHREATRGLDNMLAESRERAVILGLSHGLAGYMLALETADSWLGLAYSDSARVAALELLIGSGFDMGDHAVWPDISRAGLTRKTSHAWCHGTVGIALSLVHCAVFNDIYDDAAAWALEAMKHPLRRRSDFCCGHAGRGQVLLEAYRVTGDDSYLRSARQIAAQHLERLRRSGRGYLVGRLGIEHFLWRLRRPSLPLLGVPPLRDTAG